MCPKRDRVTEKHAGGNRVFVDSGAPDQNHEDADRAFSLAVASKRPMLTTNLILAETHRFFLHKAGIRAAAAALSKIEFAGAVHHQSAKSWMEKLDDQPISYTDAVTFALVEALGCSEAISYAHHFRIAGCRVPGSRVSKARRSEFSK
jgi:predicted nucleic acid-binding protein